MINGNKWGLMMFVDVLGELQKIVQYLMSTLWEIVQKNNEEYPIYNKEIC